MTLHDFCKSKSACDPGLKFVENLTIEEFVKTCDRGDWMLWLGRRLNLDIRKFTLAKALCANTVRHLMNDERSTNAVDVAIQFGQGEATKEELDAAATAAYAAVAAVAAYAVAAYAAYAAYAAATTSANAAANAAAATTSRKETLNTCADICRETIGELMIQRFNELNR